MSKQNWVITTLNEITEINPTLDKSLFPDDLTVAFVPMPAVEAGTGKIDVNSIRKFGDVKKGYTPFQKNDILFAKITPCMENGKMAIVPTLSNEIGFGSTEFHVLRPRKGVDPSFIYYFVSSEKFRYDAEHNMTGAVGQRRVPTPYLQNHPVPLPPFAEQKRIIAKIEELFSEIDKGIESLMKAQELLKAYRQSLLKNAFEGKLTEKWREKNSSQCYSLKGQAIQKQELQKLPLLPSYWQYVPLSQFIENIDAGKSFKCEEREPTSGEVGVAKVSAVTWGEYNESESKTCKDPNKINPKYYINEGDFLFSRANTIDLVGACVIVRQTQKTIMLSDKTLRIKFNFFDPLYFLLYLRSTYGRNEIMKRSTGNQDSMRNIGQEQIRNIIIPLCSKEEHLEIIKIVTEKLLFVENIEKSICDEIKKAKILYQSILNKAFSGELVFQEANDEPANIILARIKAENKIQKPQKKKSKQLQKVAV